MLKNYFKILIRNMYRNKGYTVISITGLAAGLVCCILILLWVQDELNFDRFHVKSDDIYRVYIEDHFPDGRINAYGVTPGPLGDALKAEYPEVIDYVRIRVSKNTTVKVGDRTFNEKNFAFADPSIFEVFTFPFVKGNPLNSLADPSSIVMTRTACEKYFGDENPMGQVIHVDDRFDFTINGIIEDVPSNSHFTFDFVVSYELLKKYGAKIDEWGSIGTYTYILLQKDIPYQDFASKIRDYLKTKSSKSITEPHLQPLVDIHLRSKSIMGMGAEGDIRYIYIFSAVAAFVLLIACINFMSLTTARSAKRAREVGMRKVAGAKRMDLILQFFSESFFFSLVALLLAMILLQFLLPAFNALAGKQIALNVNDFSGKILWTVAIALITGMISGIYPAMFLSSLQPVDVLKAPLTRGKRGSTFRRVLVVTQFSLSIILIVGTLQVARQLDYIRNQNLGFDKDNLLYVAIPGNLAQGYESIKHELSELPGVEDVTAASDLPTRVRISSHGAFWEGKDPEEMVELKILYVDYDYAKTLGLTVAEGRFFSEDFASDKQEAFVLNQAAVKAMALRSSIGKAFEMNRKGTIVGIVQDFHFSSLHQAIQPLVMMASQNNLTHFILRIRSDNIPSTIGLLKNTWTRITSGYPFEYGFVDERIDSLYGVERRVGKIFGCFTMLSILISCLGLFSLASFSAELRTREIAVRKVLGAQIPGIIYLLSKEFAKLVLIAALLAWPVAYVVMEKWLGSFAYRVTNSAGTFILSAALALVISQLTVGYQTVRAASANPVDALKYE
jgi:putative ABC transport system permease protein